MSITSIQKLYELFLINKKVTKDTRTIEPGNIFFALKGDRFNGNQFAGEALEKGAAYAVVDEEKYAVNDKFILVDDCLATLQELARYHRSKLKIPIIGITGSNGKTTTKELIHAVLSAHFQVQATKGNYNNHIGVPLTLLSIDEQHELAIVEMGANHQGEIDFLCSIAQPSHGLITNIGKAHLEGFGGIEGVKKGKSELYRHLAKTNGMVFINQDDEVLTSLNPVENTFSYGQMDSPNVKGFLEETNPFLKGKWEASGKNGSFSSQLYGTYNFYNILAAIAIGHYFKVPINKIGEAIGNYQAETNRSQLIEMEDHKIFLDAYNANPNSMKLSIKNFENEISKQNVVLLGDMFELGEYAAKEHAKIIRQVSSSSNIDLGVFVGEFFYDQRINHPTLLFFQTTEEAKSWFQEFAKKGKAFLLKGSRGMAMESIIK